MSEYLLLAIAGLIVITLVRAIQLPQRFYEFPYFMAAVFGVFILPQAISLVRFPAEATPNAVFSTLLMIMLCLSACLLGYRSPANRWILEHASIPLDERRVFQGGVFYIILAYFFAYLMSQLTYQERGGDLWSGKVTIYEFGAALIYPGLSICLTHALRYRSQAAWLMTAVAGCLPFVSTVFFGRREEAALVAMTIALTLYFNRRVVVPRILIVAALVFAAIMIPATSQYRMAMKTGNVSRLREFDFVENFSQFLNKAQILELRNAAMMIEATQLTGQFGYGRAYWDQLVFRFVPAQIIGRDIKNALMFHPIRHDVDKRIQPGRYQRPVGTTVTGMGDSFHEFWYFGALFFAILAVIFKSLWHASLQQHAIFAQLLYIQTSTAAMRAVTHQTVDYLPGLLYNLFFIGLVVYFARSRRPSVSFAAPTIGRRLA